jgi:ATP-dependent Clp protease, protease subunit
MVESKGSRKENAPKLNVRRTRLIGPINSSSVGDVMRDIDYANEQQEFQGIKMVLGSSGGSIYDAITLYDHIRASEKPVDIIAAGHCMSAAVTILQAGDKRLSYPNTTFMIHPASYSTGQDNLDGVKLKLSQYEKLDETFFELTRKRAGISKEEWEKLYDPIKYFTAEEAKRMGPNGLIDDIVVFKK